MTTISNQQILNLYKKLGIPENVSLNNRTQPNRGTLSNRLATTLNTKGTNSSTLMQKGIIK